MKLEMVDRECFTVAPFDGHYERVLECGTRRKKGDVVGLLHDFDHIDMPPGPPASRSRRSGPGPGVGLAYSPRAAHRRCRSPDPLMSCLRFCGSATLGLVAHE